ncbi:MAG: tryptophan synthase subunit alpha [Armatimonadota bacterium]
MSRIEETFAGLKAEGKGGLVMFVTAGHPSLEATAEIVPAMAEAGADVVELGVPFSDPLADGPVIQAASQHAIDGGTTTARVLGCVERIRERTDVPLVLMGSYNPILQYGVEAFAHMACRAGVDGVIVSDLPPSESEEWLRAARAQGLDTIFLVAPTSTPERVAAACECSTGFVYIVSRTGVTGARDELPQDLVEMGGKVREHTDRPLAVGFGIKTSHHVAQVNQIADAAVVGSALVRRIAEHGAQDGLVEVVRETVAELARGKAPMSP